MVPALTAHSVQQQRIYKRERRASKWPACSHHAPHAIGYTLEGYAVACDVVWAIDRHIERRGAACISSDGPHATCGVSLPGDASVEDGPRLLLPEVLPQVRDIPEAR